MHKGILRIVIVLIAGLLSMAAAHASDYKGGYLGGKFGVNISEASGAINAPRAGTFAYAMQGGYLQGGYNWDLSAVTIGVGTYADFNSYEKHTNGVAYGSRAYGLDAKLGYPVDDWLVYAKIGYGYSVGTRDLRAVKQKSANSAVGVEYNFLARWGAIVEYKTDAFSNKDSSIKITNKTLSFGLNYYFDRPEVEEVVVNTAPIFDGPEPELDLDFIASDSPPDIGGDSSTITPQDSITLDPESWKALLEGKAVRIEGANFISETNKLMGVVSKELDETAEFAAKHPDAKLEVAGYSDSSEKKARQLSLGRAQAIKKYLVKKGVAAKRISVKNKGPADPIGDNNTEEGRAKNRRVEIRATVKEQKKVSLAASTPASDSTPSTAPKAGKILLEGKPVLVNIESPGFDSGSGDSSSNIAKKLDEVAEFAGKYPERILELTGYADSSGSAKLSQKMSLERAESAKKYLVKKGVAADRITTKGGGSTNPVADNKTKEGRAKNRRVEIQSVVKEQNNASVVAPAPTPAPAPAPAPVPASDADDDPALQ